MSDNYSLLNTLGLGSSARSRVTAPDRRAYDPSSMEVALANQLTQPGASQLMGYFFGAGLDRENSGDQYTLALDQSNRHAVQASAADNQSQERRANMQMLASFAPHPGSMGLISTIRDQLAPGMTQRVEDISLANLDKTRSESDENRAQATQARAAAARPASGGINSPANQLAARRLTLAEQEAEDRQFDRTETAAARAGQNAAALRLRSFGQAVLPGTSIPMPGQAPLSREQMRLVEEDRANAETTARSGREARRTGNAAPSAPAAQPSAPAAAQPTAAAVLRYDRTIPAPNTPFDANRPEWRSWMQAQAAKQGIPTNARIRFDPRELQLPQ